eukprot:UN14644
MCVNCAFCLDKIIVLIRKASLRVAHVFSRK